MNNQPLTFSYIVHSIDQDANTILLEIKSPHFKNEQMYFFTLSTLFLDSTKDIAEQLSLKCKHLVHEIISSENEKAKNALISFAETNLLKEFNETYSEEPYNTVEQASLTEPPINLLPQQTFFEIIN